VVDEEAVRHVAEVDVILSDTVVVGKMPAIFESVDAMTCGEVVVGWVGAIGESVGVGHGVSTFQYEMTVAAGWRVPSVSMNTIPFGVSTARTISGCLPAVVRMRTFIGVGTP
jgi:hypothetical protein